MRAKSNIGPDSGGVEYRLFNTLVPGHDFIAQRVDWGEALEGTARELMAVEEPDAAGDAADDAESFLADLLRDGPMETREIRAAACNNGAPSLADLEHRQKEAGHQGDQGGSGGWKEDGL